MPRQGLSRAVVVQTAVELIEEYGIAQFSLGKLARRLNVKTASLYNHVDSHKQLMECVSKEAIRRLVQAEETAIAGKSGDKALYALAEAFRRFAREHVQLYRIIMVIPEWDDPSFAQEASIIIAPMLRVLSEYGLSTTQKYHWQRIIRSMMVGFAFHEQANDFSYIPVDREESFRIAIQCVADGLHKAGGLE